MNRLASIIATRLEFADISKHPAKIAGLVFEVYGSRFRYGDGICLSKRSDDVKWSSEVVSSDNDGGCIAVRSMINSHFGTQILEMSHASYTLHSSVTYNATVVTFSVKVTDNSTGVVLGEHPHAVTIDSIKKSLDAAAAMPLSAAKDIDAALELHFKAVAAVSDSSFIEEHGLYSLPVSSVAEWLEKKTALTSTFADAACSFYATKICDDRARSKVLRSLGCTGSTPSSSVDEWCESPVFVSKRMLTVWIGFLRVMKSDHPLLVLSRLGSGKRTAIQAFASLMGIQLDPIFVNSELEEGNLYGEYQLYVEPGTEADSAPALSSRWVDGQVTNAALQGNWILLNHINSGSSKLLESMNAPLESPPTVLSRKTEAGRTAEVPIATSFRAVGTMVLPDDEYFKELAASLTNRFVLVLMPDFFSQLVLARKDEVYGLLSVKLGNIIEDRASLPVLVDDLFAVFDAVPYNGQATLGSLRSLTQLLDGAVRLSSWDTFQKLEFSIEQGNTKLRTMLYVACMGLFHIQLSEEAGAAVQKAMNEHILRGSCR